MSFLQPLLLYGLPLIALPLVIHLINRQRHRTVPWAAMMFLLDAKRLTRGMAKLRYWLIMAMRMLAIAGLVFAISRPLASGWVGLTIGGRPDTTIVVLDRSSSMEQQDLQAGESKRSTGLQKLAQLVRTYGQDSKVALIENTCNRAQLIDSAEALLELPDTGPSDTSADVPAMLATALEYVEANQTGRTDIWVCSDLRENDWRADDGRWNLIRTGFEAREGIRFHLLSYPAKAGDNVAVTVENVRRRNGEQRSELVMDINIRRQSGAEQPLSLPVEIVINDARSVVNVEMEDDQYTLQGHTIPLDETTTSGWGRVEIPRDSNPQDNVFYFVFAEPPEHHTVIVAEDSRVADMLRLAATSPADPTLTYRASVIQPDRLNEIDWESVTVLLWQAPLPSADEAQLLTQHVESGKPIVCFPPLQSAGDEWLGIRWGDWQQDEGGKALPIASWRGDSGILRHTQSGSPLPVGQLRVFKYRSLEGSTTALARLQNGSPLVAKLDQATASAYFFATLPRSDYSSLAHDGVVFYVIIQRALSEGVALQGAARQITVGTSTAMSLDQWTSLTPLPDGVPSSARAFHAGAVQNEERLIALNRPSAEDVDNTLVQEDVDQLFSGLDYRYVTDEVGSTSSLASEIWRAFLIVMAAALLLEAWLSLPEKKSPQTAFAAVSTTI